MGMEQGRHRPPPDGTQREGEEERRTLRDPDGHQRRVIGRAAALPRQIDATARVKTPGAIMGSQVRTTAHGYPSAKVSVLASSTAFGLR